MSVTQEMIDALFESEPEFGTVQACAVAAEREYSRVPFRGRASAVVFPPHSSPKVEPVESEVLTTDISRGGLSLLHRRELKPGQQVLLNLARGTCTVEVCWCERAWPGLYVAGCRFVDATFTQSVG